MGTEIKPPLEMRIKDEPEPRRFHSWEALRDWAAMEMNQWRGFVERTQNVRRPSWLRVAVQSERLQNIKLYCDNAITAPNDADRKAILDTLQQESRWLSEQPFVFSDRARGAHLLALAEAGDFQRAVWMLAAWNPSVIQSPGNMWQEVHQDQSFSFFILLTRGIADAAAFDAGLSPSVSDANRDALKQLLSKWSNKLADFATQRDALSQSAQKYDDQVSDILKKNTAKYEFIEAADRTKVDKLVEKIKTDAAEAFKKLSDELAEIKKKYSSELALKEPVSYWVGNVSHHSKIAWRWAGAFALTILAVVAVISCYSQPILKFLGSITTATGGIAWGPAFVVAAPAFIVIWILRLVARQMNASLIQMHDSKEREVMTRAFLAFWDHGQVKAEDRLLMLNALFRPSTVTASDDGAPPNWIDILMERLRPKDGPK